MEVNFSITSWGTLDFPKNKLVNSTSSWYLALNIFTKVESAIEIWSQKTSFWITIWPSRLLTLVWVICTSKMLPWKLHVVHHVMQHPKWLLGNGIMDSKLIFGVVVLYFMQWCAVTCLSRIQRPPICIKRSWEPSILYQSSWVDNAKTSLEESSILIQRLDLPSTTLEITLGLCK